MWIVWCVTAPIFTLVGMPLRMTPEERLLRKILRGLEVQYNLLRSNPIFCLLTVNLKKKKAAHRSCVPAPGSAAVRCEC
jgi:hypothetical protein